MLACSTIITVSGEDGDVYEISAVAYWFADKLRQELDVPVGILNEKLSEIRYFKIKFQKSAFDKADISLDSFSFTSDGKEIKETKYSVFKLFDIMSEVIGNLLIKIDNLIYT